MCLPAQTWQYSSVCIEIDGVKKISQMHSSTSVTKLTYILTERKQRSSKHISTEIVWMTAFLNTDNMEMDDDMMQISEDLGNVYDVEI